MKSASLIGGFVIIFILIGDAYFRDFFQSIWLILSILFFVFLVVYQYLDRKGIFLPGKSNKKDKES